MDIKPTRTISDIRPPRANGGIKPSPPKSLPVAVNAVPNQAAAKPIAAVRPAPSSEFQVAGPAMAPTQQSAPRPKKRRIWLKVLIAIIIILLVAAGAFAYYWFYYRTV